VKDRKGEKTGGGGGGGGREGSDCIHIPILRLGERRGGKGGKKEKRCPYSITAHKKENGRSLNFTLHSEERGREGGGGGGRGQYCNLLPSGYERGRVEKGDGPYFLRSKLRKRGGGRERREGENSSNVTSNLDRLRP